MTDTPTPMQRVSAAHTDDTDARMRQRVAALHDPAADTEADRLAAIGETVPLSAVLRTALGYHQQQRAAAAALSITTKET